MKLETVERLQERIAELEAALMQAGIKFGKAMIESTRLTEELKAAREEQTRLNSLAHVAIAERDSIYKKWETARERIAVLENTLTKYRNMMTRVATEALAAIPEPEE